MHHNRQTSAASLSSAAVAPATAGQRRASTRKPLTSFSTLTISNRNWKLLEIPATPTKHSPDPISNRNKNSGIACEFGKPQIRTEECQRHSERAGAGCSPTPPKISPTPETLPGPLIRRLTPVDAGSRLSRSGRLRSARHRAVNSAGFRLTPTQPAPTGSSVVKLGPSSARTLILFFSRRRTACAAGYSTTYPTVISNRHWKRLEIAVTHTKQSTDPFLIDNENALSRTRITVAISLSTIDDWQSANVYIPIKRSSRKTTACEVVGPARSARSYSVEL
jgi:hypothetical protein